MDVSIDDRRKASPPSVPIGTDALTAPWRTDVLAGPPSERLDRMTQIVATQMKVPMVAVSLIDDKRHVTISTHGLPRGEHARDYSPCSLVVDSGAPLNVSDAPADARYAGFPMIQGPLHVRGYLAVPLRTDDDDVLGTLCLLDRRRREFTAEELQVLSRFGKAVEHLLRRR
jgi:GAF domain-containing protein